MSQLIVIARIKAKPGKEHTVREALRALIEPTHKEHGCIMYDLHVANDDPSLFYFYEKWTSEKELDAHLESPHLQQFKKQAADLVEEMHVHRLTQIG